MNQVIRIKHLKKSYNKPVLVDINLKINRGEFVSIVGKSGCGKSTLLNILGCIEHYDSGSYMFLNEAITNHKDSSDIRINHIGFIFQNYNLIDNYTCLENILLPSLYSEKETLRIDEVITMLEIEDILNKDINVLSGGEKQRVAIARALLLKPDFIIADEPTGNLDERSRDKVIKALTSYIKKYNGALLLVTHDMSLAKLADTSFELSDGCLYEI